MGDQDSGTETERNQLQDTRIQRKNRYTGKWGKKKERERDSEQDKGMERKREGWGAGQKAGKKRYC